MADETCLSSLPRQMQRVTLTGETQLDKLSVRRIALFINHSLLIQINTREADETQKHAFVKSVSSSSTLPLVVQQPISIHIANPARRQYARTSPLPRPTSCSASSHAS
jgi:hypothetical protein